MCDVALFAIIFYCASFDIDLKTCSIPFIGVPVIVYLKFVRGRVFEDSNIMSDIRLNVVGHTIATENKKAPFNLNPPP